MRYIDLSKIVQLVKASIVVISIHLKISTLFVVSHFLIAKVSPEWRTIQVSGLRKSVPFPLIEVLFEKR